MLIVKFCATAFSDIFNEIKSLYSYSYVMLCYVMLCYVMLCYVMLCYVMLVVYLQQNYPR